MLRCAACFKVDFQCGVGSLKESLFKLVMKWRKDIDNQMNRFCFTNASVVRSALGDWLGRIRLNGTEIVPTHAAGNSSIFTGGN